MTITTKTITSKRLGTISGNGVNLILNNPVESYRYITPHNTVVIGTDSHVVTMDSDWKMKVDKKIDATLPYERRGYSVQRNASQNLKVRGKVYWGQKGPFTAESFYTMSPTYPLVNEPLVRSDIDDLSVKRFKRELSDDIGMFNAMVPIAELRELNGSCQSLVHSATRVARAVTRMGFAKRSVSPMSFFSFAADAWLQWSFGIKPMLSDIKQANAAITKFITRKDRIIRVEKGAGLDYKGAKTEIPLTGPLGFNQVLVITPYSKYRTKLIGEFDVKLVSSFDYTTSDWWGINWQGTASTLYELTPFSWLVDYFTTLGDVLSDDPIVPANAGIFLTRGTSVRTIYDCRFEARPTWPKNVDYYSNIVDDDSQVGSASAFAFKRTKLATIPSRTLRLKTHQELMGIDNGVSKLLNLLSVSRMLSESKRQALTKENERELRRKLRRL